jgi:hypothetical protein
LDLRLLLEVAVSSDASRAAVSSVTGAHIRGGENIAPAEIEDVFAAAIRVPTNGAE